MKVVFGWRRLTPPAFIGGAELTEGSLATLAARSGHTVEFVGSYQNPRSPSESSRSWLVELLRAGGIPWTDIEGGIRYRYRDVWCTSVSQDLVAKTLNTVLANADMFFTSQEGCVELAQDNSDAQIFSYVHSASEIGMMSARIRRANLIAPSNFIKNKIEDLYRLPSILLRPPLSFVDRRKEACQSATSVMFVNPVPEKGVDVALAIANSMPKTRFRFVRAWPMRSELDLPPNVELFDKTLDMDTLYRDSSVLIVPSRVEDASPRVISEAARFGIPSIGAPVGGIPELIYDRGLLAEADDVGQWVHLLHRLLNSADERLEIGAAQFRHCQDLFSSSEVQALSAIGL